MGEGLKYPIKTMCNRLIVIGLMLLSLRQAAICNDAQTDTKPDQRQKSAELPALLRLNNGTAVSTRQMWQQRRLELEELMQAVVYGHPPARPDQVTCSNFTTSPILNCDGTEERMTLVIGFDVRLQLRLALYRPTVAGPLPVIIREEHALGHIEEVPDILERGYMFVEFQREDLDPDRSDTIGPAQAAYPDADWATLAVWAWGAMRVADYLETRDDVDLSKLAIAGHSRGGKMALLAGALDERFALVAANGSGCGGAGCFRIQSGKVETLELITRPDRFSYWFHSDLRRFANKEDQLPVDQHFLKALVAPRALICTDALGDEWANSTGNRATSAAAEQVFRFLGAAQRNGLHFREGSHDMTEADWAAILDFADWHLRGRIPDNQVRFFQFAVPDE
jgi:dienelactone hydrolase